MSYVPAPAMTVARPPTSSTATRKRSSFSASLRVGDSPVVPADDEPVRAVLDEEDGELAKPLEVDRTVGTERRHDRGQDRAEHLEEVYESEPCNSCKA